MFLLERFKKICELTQIEFTRYTYIYISRRSSKTSSLDSLGSLYVLPQRRFDGGLFVYETVEDDWSCCKGGGTSSLCRSPIAWIASFEIWDILIWYVYIYVERGRIFVVAVFCCTKSIR